MNGQHTANPVMEGPGSVQVKVSSRSRCGGCPILTQHDSSQFSLNSLAGTFLAHVRRPPTFAGASATWLGGSVEGA